MQPFIVFVDEHIILLLFYRLMFCTGWRWYLLVQLSNAFKVLVAFLGEEMTYNEMFVSCWVYNYTIRYVYLPCAFNFLLRIARSSKSFCNRSWLFLSRFRMLASSFRCLSAFWRSCAFCNPIAQHLRILIKHTEFKSASHFFVVFLFFNPFHSPSIYFLV